MTDRRVLYAAVFLRALATGMIGVLLGVHLAKLKLGAAASGLVVTAGLAGAAGAALLATLAGDRWGRKRFLIGLSLVSAGGGALFALTRDPLLMAGAAFLGMVNGMGCDRGAALILEQAILPSTAGDDTRTRAFAVYNILQDVGHAFGSLLAGLPALLGRMGLANERAAFLSGRASRSFMTCSSTSPSGRSSRRRRRSKPRNHGFRKSRSSPQASITSRSPSR